MGFVILWLFCGIVASIIASNKGRSGCGWFLLGVLLGPFAFAVALLPRVDSGTTKVCPQCAEEVKAAAKICRFCHYEFPESPSQTEPVAWEKRFYRKRDGERKRED